MKFRLDGWLARCASLAAGHVPDQSCRTTFTDDLRWDLRSTRSGQHCVIFAESDTLVQIVDFRHQSAGIAAKPGGS